MTLWEWRSETQSKRECRELDQFIQLWNQSTLTEFGDKTLENEMAREEWGEGSARDDFETTSSSHKQHVSIGTRIGIESWASLNLFFGFYGSYRSKTTQSAGSRQGLFEVQTSFLSNKWIKKWTRDGLFVPDQVRGHVDQHPLEGRSQTTCRVQTWRNSAKGRDRMGW